MSHSSASAWTVRTLTEDDWAGYVNVDAHAFGATAPAELLEAERRLVEPGRSIGAYDSAGGADLVGIATAYSYRLSVPGGRVPAAAVSGVGVLPTHRRRGVLSALMEHQLTTVHEAGVEPIAILWASEPQIYGRFGYGPATWRYSLQVGRSAPFHPDLPHDPELGLRLADPADWQAFAGVYAAAVDRRAGLPERDERWWRRAVRDIPALREGRSELRCVLVTRGSEVRGYALYSTKQDFGEGFGRGLVSVREVLAGDAASLAALYRYLVDLDLMGRTDLWNVPVDDPLLHWLADPYRAEPRLHDALYVRLVDLGTALASRTYGREVDVVLEVADRTCPWNAGRWRVAGGPDGATCSRTEGTADLALDVRALGAAYLGGTSLVALAGAGRVRALRPGALVAASEAFRTSVAPWNPAVF